MKIFFVASDTQALGGIQQYNRKFLDVLQKRGDEVKLLELKSSGFFSKLRFIADFFVKSIKFKPDINICAHINYAPLGFLAKRFFGRKYIVCTHGIDVWNIKSALKRKAMREAKLITTVAEYTRDKIVFQLPETKGKIYLLYNPIDGKKFKPEAKRIDLLKRYNLQGKKVIFTIARLLAMEGYKGYDRVIEAMPEILKVLPNAVYLLAGSGDDAPRIQKLISDFDLQDKVLMAGYVSDEEIVNYYNLADVFVMPSKAEGAPAVFTEALACGMPVIAGNQDGSKTPLQNGETGLLINPESVSEIASAIINVLTSRVRKELLDRDFLRRKTLDKFGLDLFPERVNEVLSMV